MKIADRILESFSLIWTSGIWPHTPNEIVKILLYAHSKGWLYIVLKEDRVVGLAIAYNVEKIEEVDKKLPIQGGGRILFVPLTIIKNGSRIYCMRRFNGWVRENEKDFDELVYEKNDHLIRKTIGGRNGKKQGLGIASAVNILSKSEC